MAPKALPPLLLQQTSIQLIVKEPKAQNSSICIFWEQIFQVMVMAEAMLKRETRLGGQEQRQESATDW